MKTLAALLTVMLASITSAQTTAEHVVPSAMTGSEVYKALAERMLIAADDTDDDERRAELLLKAEKALERYEAVLEREQRAQLPAAMINRFEGLLEAIEQIAAKVAADAKALRERAKPIPTDAAAREDLQLELTLAIDRFERLGRLAKDARANIESERASIAGILHEHPEISSGNVLGIGTSVLATATDAVQSIDAEQRRLEVLQNRVHDAGRRK